MLCAGTLAASLVVCGLAYRLHSVELGLRKLSNEFGVLLCVAATEAFVLYLVVEVVGWTHWLQYVVAVLVGGLGYKIAHVTEMDEYQPFAIAIVQFVAFWPALKFLQPLLGNLARRLPMFA